MKHIALIAAVTLAMAAPASAATVLSYVSGGGTSLTANETALGVTGADLQAGAGLVAKTNNQDTFNFKNWTVGGDFKTARTHQDTITWGFSSTKGYDLTNLEIAYDRNRRGPKQIRIAAVINGTIIDNLFSDSFVKRKGETAIIDLSSFDNVTSASFLLAGWDAQRNGGQFDLENKLGDGDALRITGALAVVPLPAGLPLMLGAFGVLGFARRRA